MDAVDDNRWFPERRRTMANDLVERLRDAGNWQKVDVWALCDEAASRIANDALQIGQANTTISTQEEQIRQLKDERDEAHAMRHAANTSWARKFEAETTAARQAIAALEGSKRDGQ